MTQGLAAHFLIDRLDALMPSPLCILIVLHQGNSILFSLNGRNCIRADPIGVHTVGTGGKAGDSAFCCFNLAEWSLIPSDWSHAVGFMGRMGLSA